MCEKNPLFYYESHRMFVLRALYNLLFTLSVIYLLLKSVFFYAGYKEEMYANNMFVRKTRRLEDLCVLE